MDTIIIDRENKSDRDVHMVWEKKEYAILPLYTNIHVKKGK